jgi:hypothetical protein
MVDTPFIGHGRVGRDASARILVAFDIGIVYFAIFFLGSSASTQEARRFGLLVLALFGQVRCLDRPTEAVEMFAEPMQTDHYDQNIDETEVGEDGDEVNVQLLVRVQSLDIDTKTVSSQLSSE